MCVSKKTNQMKNIFGAILIFFFLLLILTGCSAIQNRLTDPPDADALSLNRGDEAFKNKDYQKALEIYSTLSRLSENEKIRRKALYGLACTKLILAETVNDLNESIILWDVWSQLVPPVTEDEDPRMLKPILLRKALPGITEEGVKKRSNTSKNKVTLKTLETKESKILQLETQLKAVEKEKQTLKQQISSLEAIDQKIQEKKKEIASP